MNTTGCLLSATEKGDQLQVRSILKNFLEPSGATKYLELIRIPTSERIPELAKTNRKKVHQLLAAQIEYSMKFLNIPNGMTLEQIFLLTDTIIDDSESDNLSMQDVFVFLQKLVSGKMGTIYNRLDIPTFMELFEVHRQQRHNELINYKYEQSIQHKALPVNDRIADMFPNDEKENIHNAMKDYLKVSTTKAE